MPSAPVSAQQTAAPQGLVVEPMRRRCRAHGADDAADLLSGVDQRQQDGLQLHPMAAIAAALQTDDSNRALLADRRQIARKHVAVGLVPAVEKVLTP